MGNKNYGYSNSKEKYKINRNNGLNNNNYVINTGNKMEISKFLFGNNNKRVTSPKVSLSQPNHKDAKIVNKGRYRLASPNNKIVTNNLNSLVNNKNKKNDKKYI